MAFIHSHSHMAGSVVVAGANLSYLSMIHPRRRRLLNADEDCRDDPAGGWSIPRERMDGTRKKMPGG